MLAKHLKELIADQGLTQAAFARRTGLPLDRVRNICKGNVQKLKDEEIKAIRDAIGARESWLVNGRGPMYLTEDERKTQPRLDELQQATRTVVGLGLEGPVASELHELLFACNRSSREGVLASLERIRGAKCDPASAELDEVLFQAVIECALETIERQGGKMAPAKLAGVLLSGYQASRARHEVDRLAIERLVKLAT